MTDEEYAELKRLAREDTPEGRAAEQLIWDLVGDSFRAAGPARVGDEIIQARSRPRHDS